MILQYIKKNKKGVDQVFYTHSSFIDIEKGANIFKSEAKRRSNFNNLSVLGVIGVSWALCNDSVRSLIPKKIPSWGVVGGFFVLSHVMYAVYNSMTDPIQTKLKAAMYQSTMPLWRDRNAVPNVDKMFFELDDDNQQKISLFHHGLTAERASKILPDQIQGRIPHPPVNPEHQHHHHH